MSAPAVLKQLSDRGLSVSLDGSDLRLEGPKSRIDPALVAAIRQAKAEIVAHLRGRTDGPEPAGAFAATAMQQSYLYGRQEHFALGNVSSHVYHEIEGVFDAARLEAALAKVVVRHPTLRTVFRADGTQLELPPGEAAPVRIPVTDLRGLPEAEREAARLAVRDAMSHQVLPADRAPLVDARLTVLSDERMVLHVSHDGLVVDGISSFLLFRDWRRFLDDPDRPAEPLGASFRAHVEALEALRATPAHARATEYWTSRLDALPPRPQLPLRVDPETVRRPVSTRRTVTLAPARWQGLKDRAAAAGLTPNAVLATAYAEVLSLWSGGEPFTLNMTLANRLPVHPDMDQLVGNFTDCLLLPVETDPAAGFEARAQALQHRLREVLDHRQFSGIEVMQALGRHRRAGRAEAMPVTFNSTVGAAQDGADGSAITAFGHEAYCVSQTPQVWLNLFLLEAEGALVAQVDAVDALFPDGLVDALVGAFGRLLEALAGGEAAWGAADQSLLPAAQAARRREANATDAPVPPGQAHARFLDRVRAAPQATAIETASKRLTYHELYAAALKAARWLRLREVRRDEPVAIVMRKGWEQIAGILGAVMSGGAYLPVDADLPRMRIDQMLRDGGVRCALVQRGVDAGVACLAIDDAFLAAAVEEAGTEVADPAPAEAGQDDLAYVLYTSGSTGTPKGVMISHRSVVNLVEDVNARFAVGPGDRLFAVSRCSFDLSVFDIFGALSAGAALAVPDADRATDPAHWLDLAEAAGASVWNSVPAIVDMLVEAATGAGRPLPERLRLVMMSGDRIPVTLPGRIAALKPDTRIVSLGGPTETTVWNILHPIDRVDPAWTSIPYGRPNANNRYYVLDRQDRECPDHVPGELCAAGIGLARGYWGDPERTAERFFHHPCLGERLYRTGDLGRYLPDGTIEILGRADFQIKLNGFRIEPGEIEAVLDGHPAVDRSAVVAAGGAQLVAFLVRANGAEDGAADLERELAGLLSARLPDYMVPRRFHWIKRLPLTGNGKVDRKSLQEAAAERAPAAAEAAPEARPETELERRLVALWSEILKTDGIEPTSEFYRLGGTSLSAVRLLARIRKDFGVSVPLTELPRLESPRGMAAHLERASHPVGAA
ncbi:amino acid adenylation domain-containing protein [Arenibaculum sp.]|jgi:amino acid adenylation domain-containing protein|uniref:non-ribosomal peptide synthetase n=1 Tax=Arenibaculum sp. TaxID=2865862 RepID=UPI002E155C1A|nr:amino acid adenylation domain-containing protein [Arenibaculum sp.]